MTKYEALCNMLERLKECDEAPERGPYYIHEVVIDEAVLIEFIERFLPEAEDLKQFKRDLS